jgi:hypothetical protein
MKSTVKRSYIMKMQRRRDPHDPGPLGTLLCLVLVLALIVLV